MKYTRPMLALTFDDGPNDSAMVQILDLLAQYDARATFFVVGEKINAPSIPAMRRAVSEGHEIGNHSLTHSHMTRMTQAEIITELEVTQARVHEATGILPKLFRPPYIDVDQRMLDNIRVPFISGTGNRDWDACCPVDERIRVALESADDGAILLLHCFEGNDATVESLKTILPELKRRGYKMVTVSELFAAKGITPETGVLYERVGG